MVMDLRAIERLPRQVTLAELRENRLLRKIKFLKNTRMTICPLTEEEYSEIPVSYTHLIDQNLTFPKKNLRM